jgi:hypothetical protein
VIFLSLIVSIYHFLSRISSSYSLNSDYILCSSLDSCHRLFRRTESEEISSEPTEIRKYTGHVNKKLTILSQSVLIQDKGYVISGSENGKVSGYIF